MQKNKKPAPTNFLRTRQARSLATVAASSTPFQTLPNPPLLTQELHTPPKTRVQKRRRIDEDKQSNKRRRTDPLSAPAPLGVFSGPISISQTAEREQGTKQLPEDQDPSAIPAAALLNSVSGPEPREDDQLRNTEDKPLDEQHQQSEVGSQLSEGNLKKLQSQLKQPKEMESAFTPADRVRKRGTVMRQRSFSDLSPETASVSVRSQKSAGSLKFYRYNILGQARVYIRCDYPPPGIQSMLDLIFKREVSKERKIEISHIAKETAQKFSSKTQGASREDDLLELLNSAFNEMFPDEKFSCPRKAGMLPFHSTQEAWCSVLIWIQTGIPISSPISCKTKSGT